MEEITENSGLDLQAFEYSPPTIDPDIDVPLIISFQVNRTPWVKISVHEDFFNRDAEAFDLRRFCTLRITPSARDDGTILFNTGVCAFQWDHYA